MSKSLKRVQRYLDNADLKVEILHLTADTKTATMAAEAVACDINQIAKSVIFLGEDSQKAILFLTAGGNRVDPLAAAVLAGETLAKADAALIRAQTGFAIGGVSPIGHLSEIQAFMDPLLLRFPTIWAAAGTPHHMFEINPEILRAEIDATVAPSGVMVCPK